MTATKNRPVGDEAAQKAFGGAAVDYSTLSARMDEESRLDLAELDAELKQTTPKGMPFKGTGRETLIAQVVDRYLKEIAGRPEVTPQQIRDELLNRINGELSLENIHRKDEGSSQPQLPKMFVLDEHTIVTVLLARKHIAGVDLLDGRGEEDMTLLCTYSETGPNAGIYVDGDAVFSRIISELAPSLRSMDIKSVKVRLKSHAPVSYRSTKAHLVAVNNGIFNTDTMTLEPFDPQLVFLAKSPIDYDAYAVSPVIIHPKDGTVWDVETWLSTLSDDPEVVQLFWEILSAVVRPHVSWNKGVFFMGEGGNNGKGTLCRLMKNLVGNSVATLKIMDFSKDFMMEGLLRATSIISDENAVGTYIDQADNFKAVITNDPILINRKNKPAIPFTFWGLLAACLNEWTLKSKDKSESFLRRVLPVPFDKKFGDVERTYIKWDYLARPEVLRYVLKRVLHMTHTRLSEPAVCKELLDEQRTSNDLRVGFWRTFKDQLAWDLVPAAFIHDLWKAYKAKVDPDGRVGTQNSLTAFLKETISSDPDWEYVKSKRPGNLMSLPEHLIEEYDLKDWMNKTYSGTDPNKKCVPNKLAVNYVGFLRHRPPVANGRPVATNTTTNLDGEDA